MAAPFYDRRPWRNRLGLEKEDAGAMDGGYRKGESSYAEDG